MTSFWHTMGNDEHIVQEIHDILLAYYKLALKRFIDDVRMHVADYHLIVGPDTPLKLFSPKLVTSLTSEQLEDVAGEDTLTKRRRQELDHQIEQPNFLGRFPSQRSQPCNVRRSQQ